MRVRFVLLASLLLLAGTAFAQQPQAPLVDAPQARPHASARMPQQEALAPSEASGQQSAEQSRQQRAQQQLKEEEHQRVLGVLPNFGTSYRADAVSLTAKQKMNLAFHSALDPATFAVAGLVAGYHEANDDYGGFGWGAQGYGKRFGAAYLDAFDGAILGGGILPSVLHQDPRYFRLGHGSGLHRTLYAMATTVICRHDNSRRWEPNYSNMGGNILAGAISNLYYPSQDSGWGQTIGNGLIVTAEGTAGAVFAEFWPDISRKLFHRDPTHGLDAQAKAADAAATSRGKRGEEHQPLPSSR